MGNNSDNMGALSIGDGGIAHGSVTLQADQALHPLVGLQTVNNKGYYMTFAFTETDDGDLTYFVLHQLKAMREALEELTSHLKERASRMAELTRTVAGFDSLNHRQRMVLQHAVRHPLQSYTIDGHAKSHHVHCHTARTDMLNLVKRGYLEGRRVGKGKRFYCVQSLPRKLGEFEPQ